MLRLVRGKCLCYHHPGIRHASLKNKLTAPGELEITLSNGRKSTFSVGKWARMADASATGRCGDTTVMVTGVASKTASSSPGFVPITVDYRQRAAAAGRIPTNHLRRELGPSEKEILVGRMIDRSIRPCFPSEFNHETQIICNLLAVDPVNDPEILSLNTCSVALACSPIPWAGPMAAVRLAIMEKGTDPIVNPTRYERSQAHMDLIIAGTSAKNVIMIEAGAKKPVELPYIEKAIVIGQKNIRNIVEGISKLADSLKIEKRPIESKDEPAPEIKARLRELVRDKLWSVFTNSSLDKQARSLETTSISDGALAILAQEFPGVNTSALLYELVLINRELYQELVVKTGLRADGRSLTDLRPLNCQVSLFEPLHGSSLFQRGQTQVICSATLDSPSSGIRMDTMSHLLTGVKEKNFMLHYEFPPFATNEIGRVSRSNRRELGHGALAEKALRPLIPDDYDFTIRLACDVLESNGSSSMASVCSGSMALMDAGVPIETHVAGVAMGLLKVSQEKPDGTEQDQVKASSKSKKTDNSKYIILTDIMGMEDFLGEMDFKIAATKSAFTALQLDVKTKGGIPYTVVFDALVQSRAAVHMILSQMNLAITKPRDVESKKNHPIISKITIPRHKKSSLYGFGGVNLKKLTAETGVQISEDAEDANQLVVFAPNPDAFNEANEWIQEIIKSDSSEPSFDFGSIIEAKVLEIKPSGIMVSLHDKLPATFLPLKELDMKKIGHPSAIGVKEGDTLHVKYFGRDPVSGHIRLSRRILQMTSARTMVTSEESFSNENS